MTTDTQPETRRFEAETQELLGLVIHSLYTQKDIFLRELISNASDALDKLRHEALTEPGLLDDDTELEIRLEVDPDARTLAVIDNGIGMTKDELAENLGTIAQSGTRRFLEQLKTAGAEQAPELIGQFGVGFYSTFIVADEVVVESRRAGTEEGARWRSTADGTYTVEDTDVGAPGTRVTLHLKALDPTDKEAQDFLSAWALRAVVKQHSDFVSWPIRMDVEVKEPVLDDDGEPVEGETQSVTKTETLNSMKPLWARPKGEVDAAAHAEFYQHLTHDWGAPYASIHFTVESPVEYTALLYVPSQRPMDMFEAPRQASRVSLYVKRVLIMPECEDLLPSWLRFVRGVVDCPDLPLNVSRQTLQANPITARISRHLVKRVLRELGDRLENDREGYAAFFDAFGTVLKEGIYHGEDDDQRISNVCLFATTAQDEPTTLAEYVERMPADQESIYYVTGLVRETLEASPHLEAYRKSGREVLLLSDPVDEWMLQRLTTFNEKPLVAAHRGDAPLESEDEQSSREAREGEQKPFFEAAQARLDDDVSAVRFSARLTDSAAILVPDESSVGPAMEQVMRDMGHNVPANRPALELNPDHPAVLKVAAWFEADAEGEAFADGIALLYGQALLAEGRTPKDPVEFSRLLARLLAKD